MNKATLITPNLPNFRGNAALYQMAPPLEGAEYVVVSAISNEFGTETMIFASTPEGNVDNYRELGITLHGRQDHEVALERSGYTVE